MFAKFITESGDEVTNPTRCPRLSYSVRRWGDGIYNKKRRRVNSTTVSKSQRHIGWLKTRTVIYTDVQPLLIWFIFCYAEIRFWFPAVEINSHDDCINRKKKLFKIVRVMYVCLDSFFLFPLWILFPTFDWFL